MSTAASNIEPIARALAERTVRSSLLCDAKAMKAAGMRPYTETDVRHYIETRWRDYADLIVNGDINENGRWLKLPFG